MECVEVAVPADVVHPLLDRGVWGGFGRFGDAEVEPAEVVKVVIEDCEAADGDVEALGEEFEPGFDPGLAVRHPLAAEKSPSDAAGNAVVVPRHRDVHQCRLGIVIAAAPAGPGNTERPYPTALAAGRQGLCLSFCFLCFFVLFFCFVLTHVRRPGGELASTT